MHVGMDMCTWTSWLLAVTLQQAGNTLTAFGVEGRKAVIV
jgi:hypothetical protein